LEGKFVILTYSDKLNGCAEWCKGLPMLNRHELSQEKKVLTFEGLVLRIQQALSHNDGVVVDSFAKCFV
jgi:hypothetical protein